MSLYFTPSSNPHTPAPTQRTVISQRKLSTSPGCNAKRMEWIEIAKTKIAERTNGKAPSHLLRAASVVWSRVESWSEEDAQARLRMLPPKSGYMLFLSAIALIIMLLFRNGFFQGIETIVAVFVLAF